MNKIEAIATIARDARLQRAPSEPDAKRMLRALKVLGLSPSEIVEALDVLEYATDPTLKHTRPSIIKFMDGVVRNLEGQ